MVISNLIDEKERLSELYGKYTDRQQHVLDIVKTLINTTKVSDRFVESLPIRGVSYAEIRWLKRTGHLLTSYSVTNDFCK